MAAGYLELRGWSVLDQNCRAAGGEIDLLARDGRDLVFVEVRLRRELAWIDAESSLRPDKRARLQRCARALLRRREDLRWPGRRIRFDVIAMSLGAVGLNLRHLRDVRL
jgi:putative endonuclease